ncbi:hypothetical protein R80B4_01253 [Fibrobacteres bacterium R8-0-B4]
MLLTLSEAGKRIESGENLHIAGSEALLRKLPKGNWIGGSTEYFMSKSGCKTADDELSVLSFHDAEISIVTYDEKNINTVALDAFDNGFSIVIIPFGSAAHTVFAEKAVEFEALLSKNIVGWISGVNIEKAGQTPVSVNGLTGVASSDKAVVMHVGLPKSKSASVGVVNIFSQDERTPTLEFPDGGFTVEKCLVDGEKILFADYIAWRGISTTYPLVGDYSERVVNVSFKSVENGVVSLYAPVFRGVKYKIAKIVPDYVEEVLRKARFNHLNPWFACNSILNFLYSKLDGKKIGTFVGPIAFGEIAYSLVNQTLVYVNVQQR